jgi:signal transduction histidine kinase
MRLVDSILDFSKMESGQLNGHFSPRNLGILSGDVAEVFRSSIEKARIEFNVSCARESDKLVYIDTSFWEKVLPLRYQSCASEQETDQALVRLRQICYNLIGNAFK